MFTDTSNSISISGPVLMAKCRNKKGEMVYSEINLDQFIGNVNGELKWRDNRNDNKDFSLLARNTRYSEGNLIAECVNRNEQWATSIINLNDHIANKGGELVFQ